MSLKAKNTKSSRREQKAEPRRQTEPPEGDISFDNEDYDSIIKKNDGFIRQLNQENKTLRKQLAEAESVQVATVALNTKGLEMEAFIGMSPVARKEALSKLEQEVAFLMRKVNAERYKSQEQNQRLNELKRVKSEIRAEPASVDIHSLKETHDEMELRSLQNRLEKTQWKCEIAEGLMNNYLKLKRHMKDESVTYQSQLDSLKAELLKSQEVLRVLKAKNKDAQLSKKAVKAELQELKEQLHRQRQERKSKTANYLKEDKERNADEEKVGMKPEVSAAVHHRSSPAEEEEVTSTFKETFMRHKEVTGAKNSQEAVERFVSQKEKQEHLEKLKMENKKVLKQLREQKRHLEEESEIMKHSREVKLLSQQKMLEEQKQQVQAQQQRYAAARERLDQIMKTFTTVQAGAENLAAKLNEDVTTEEKLVDLMKLCKLKSEMLLRELEGKDLAAVKKEIEENQFWARMQTEMPDDIRVKLPEDHRADVSDKSDNTEAGSDEDEDEDDVV